MRGGFEGARRVRHVRWIRLAVCGRAAEAERLEDAQASAGKDAGIRCHEQGFAEAGVPIRGVDDLLRADAGDGDGERSSGELLSVRGVEALVPAARLACVGGGASLR